LEACLRTVTLNDKTNGLSWSGTYLMRTLVLALRVQPWFREAAGRSQPHLGASQVSVWPWICTALGSRCRSLCSVLAVLCHAVPQFPQLSGAALSLLPGGGGTSLASGCQLL